MRPLDARKPEETRTPIRELPAFRVKINIQTGHDSYEAWREGDHDDLVLAVGLATWYAERRHGTRGVITAATRALARPTDGLLARLGGLGLRGY